MRNVKLNYVLDETRPMEELIVKDGQTGLTRENLVTLGLRREMDSIVRNIFSLTFFFFFFFF